MKSWRYKVKYIYLHLIYISRSRRDRWDTTEDLTVKYSKVKTELKLRQRIAKKGTINSSQVKVFRLLK